MPVPRRIDGPKPYPLKSRNPAMEVSADGGVFELRSGAGSLSCSDAVVAAAHRGEGEAVLEWLEGGGPADATYKRGGVSGFTLLMGGRVAAAARR